MPLKLGTTNIGAIYKGTTPISSIYKGTTLVFSSYSWQEYLYEYLYHNLVPTTINNKQVQDKAKLVEIQGNSCVVNQLAFINSVFFTSSFFSGTATIDENNKLTLTGSFISTGNRAIGNKVSIISGRKYLRIIKINGTISENLRISFAYYFPITINAGTYNDEVYNDVLSATGTNNNYMAFESMTTTQVFTNFSIQIQLIDLTQQFPFDTPTTLTDNRVKRIIEQGYIPYNSGEIKDSVVGEISFSKIGIEQQYLPSEYQEVEYLESTGTQAIDTGVYNNDNNEFEIDFAIGNTSANRNYVIGGASTSPTVDRTQFSYSANAFIGWGKNSHTTLTLNVDTNKHKILMNKSNFVLDNVVVYTPNDHTFLGTDKSYLFAMVYSNSVSPTTIYTNKLKIYKAKIKNNGTLIRNFIPCYRKSDNVAGLYDLANNLFYTNNGTGTFAIGKKVNNNTMIKLPAPLDLDGVNTAHNTFAITKTNYVFTRNVWNYTFTGSETWTLEGNYQKYYTSMNVSDNLSAKGVSTSFYGNIICDEYITERQNEMSEGRVDKAIAVGSNATTKTICVRDTTNITSTATAQSYMTGKTIYYQLATPQVINIPRKNLGVIDLGSLTFTRYSFSGTYCFYAQISAMKETTKNVFCSKYMFNDTNISQLNNKQITVATNYIYIRDDTYTDATDFKNAMSGVYLFYETNAETTDFNDEMFIQSGGTITTDSEVLPNITLGVKCK